MMVMEWNYLESEAEKTEIYHRLLALLGATEEAVRKEPLEE